MGNDNFEGDAESPNSFASPTDTRTPGQRPARLSTDTVHRILSSERRRHLLSYLIDWPDDTTSVDEVVDHITQEERPTPGPISHRERVAIDLHHVHLPKLADAGVIEHDPVAETIRYEAPEGLATLLAATDEFEAEEA